NLYQRFVPKLAYAYARLGYSSSNDYGKYVKECLDLLRISLASKLRSLETGQQTTDTQQLVPKYLTTNPQDPATSSSYLFNPQQGVFYSVGPDGQDDAMRMHWHVFTRPRGRGDVWLE